MTILEGNQPDNKQLGWKPRRQPDDAPDDNARQQPRWQHQMTTLDANPDDNQDEYSDDNTIYNATWQYQRATPDDSSRWQHQITT
jgi:hypothetical protein